MKSAGSLPSCTRKPSGLPPSGQMLPTALPCIDMVKSLAGPQHGHGKAVSWTPAAMVKPPAGPQQQYRTPAGVIKPSAGLQQQYRTMLLAPLSAPSCAKRLPECPLLVCRPATGRRRSCNAWDDCESSSSSHDSHEAAHLSPDAQAVLHLLSVEPTAKGAARQLPARDVEQARSSLQSLAAAAPAAQVSPCAGVKAPNPKGMRLRQAALN